MPPTTTIRCTTTGGVKDFSSLAAERTCAETTGHKRRRSGEASGREAAPRYEYQFPYARKKRNFLPPPFFGGDTADLTSVWCPTGGREG